MLCWLLPVWFMFPQRFLCFLAFQLLHHPPTPWRWLLPGGYVTKSLGRVGRAHNGGAIGLANGPFSLLLLQVARHQGHLGLVGLTATGDTDTPRQCLILPSADLLLGI